MVNLFSLPGIDPPRLQPDPTLPVPVPAPVNPFQVGGVQVPMTSPYQVINDGSYSGLVVGNMTDRDRLVAAGYRDPVRIVERGLESMVPRRAATNRDPLTRASEQLTSAMIEGERY